MVHPNGAWIFKVFLQCAMFIAVSRQEEVFNTTPPPVRTNFSCYGRKMGFYADVEADCKVYHTCDDHGNKFSYRCPEETAFRQDALICDHAHLVDCRATSYPGNRDDTDEKGKEGITHGLASFLNAPSSLESTFNDQTSFSRTFQVVRPDKSTPDKSQPGFVFSASVFLRDQHERGATSKNSRFNDGQSTKAVTSSTVSPILITRSSKPSVDFHCNASKGSKVDQNPKNDVFFLTSTARPFLRNVESKLALSGNRFPDFRESKNIFQGQKESRDGAEIVTRTPTTQGLPLTTVKSLWNRMEHTTMKVPVTDQPKFNSNAYNGDYPYFETLRSIQANSRSTITTTTSSARSFSTTELPVHALTMSLKPLVPNELEYDPYYPNMPTTTEAYYTPSYRGDEAANRFNRFTTQTPWTNVHFEIPAVLPDLNTLEDLVDRRKLFYIPRVKAT